MDLHALRNRLLQYERELKSDPNPNAAKLKKIENICFHIERRLREVRELEFATRVRREIRGARDKLAEGKSFMALDIERTMEGQLHEIGVTILRRNKPIECYNYRLRGIQRGPQFVFGKTIEANESVVRNLIRIHAQSVDYYIGHNFTADLKHLNAEYIEIPNKYFYDTAKWSKVLHGHFMKLGDMARHYGLEGRQFHCAGNDARYTAEIFLKIIKEI